MGRAIKKKWFSAKAGSVSGDLTLTLSSGTEKIIKQVGTGVYEVASGRVKLVDGGPLVAPDPLNGVVGTATLQHESRFVKKINQYVVTYFDDEDEGTVDTGVWNNGKGTIVGTLVPPLTTEGEQPPVEPDPVQATATATSDGNTVDSITITDGGSGYESAPSVSIVGDGSGATATAILTDGVVTDITLDNGGTGYGSAPTVTIDAPVVVAAATTKKTKKSKK